MSGLTTTDRLQELLPQLFSSKKLEGKYYLRFQLSKDISGLIDLKYVRESLTIAGDRLTAVPNLPEYVVGLMSSRNQVFLAMDLAHLAGLKPETVNLRQYQTIVVQLDVGSPEQPSEEIALFGLTVPEINGIARILPQEFETSLPSNIPKSLALFIRGSILQQNQDEDAPNTNSNSARYSYLIDIPELIVTNTKSQS